MAGQLLLGKAFELRREVLSYGMKNDVNMMAYIKYLKMIDEMLVSCYEKISSEYIPILNDELRVTMSSYFSGTLSSEGYLNKLASILEDFEFFLKQSKVGKTKVSNRQNEGAAYANS